MTSYDEMFLSEIIEENPKDAPDGEIFRKDHVDIVAPRQKVIHKLNPFVCQRQKPTNING